MKKFLNRFYLFPPNSWDVRLSLWRQGFCNIADGLVMALSLGFVGSSFALNCAKNRSKLYIEKARIEIHKKLQNRKLCSD